MMDVQPIVDDLLLKFRERDRLEGAFHPFIDAHTRLVKDNVDKGLRISELEAETEALRHTEADLRQQLGIVREQGSPLNQQRTQELEQQLQVLKEEQSELYKTQGQNAQRLLDMSEQLRTYYDRDKQLNEESQTLNARVTKLDKQVETQILQLREKDVTIQASGRRTRFLLQDELTAIQLELFKTEEKLKDLEADNAQLLQRWLKKMNEEAERMNEGHPKVRHHLPNILHPYPRSLSLADLLKPTMALHCGYHPRLSSIWQTAHDGEICTLATSTDSNTFATGGSDKKVKVFETSAGTLKHTLTGSLQAVMCVSYSNSDDFVLGACNDHSTRLWSLATGRLRHTLTGHIGKVYAARFNNDSSKVVSGSHDRTLKLWDLQKGYCTRTMFTFSSCNDVCLLDPDGATIASGHLDNNIRLWDSRTGNGIKEIAGIHTGQITSLCISNDGSRLLTNSRDNTLKLLDMRQYATVATFSADGFRNGLNWSRACFSPDGAYVVAGSADGTLFFWNTATGKLMKSIKEHEGPICAVSWSPNGTQLFSAEKDRTVCMWHPPDDQDI
ncbi:hypothetical protein BZG36_01350 [Bifiguratus adelaidae]|uniref:Autophagy-related protein 16 domain-containing protein n=1 Tax=Bifiguratus adelaidae TaxID=1938954 RepID=A0A261Y3B4_9FUNG|nr:hypothetical protein BZG36_01350 [Bifiguratus adelaidae]